MFMLIRQTQLIKHKKPNNLLYELLGCIYTKDNAIYKHSLTLSERSFVDD